MATPAQHVLAIEAALAENAAVTSVTVDGTTVRYDRKQAIEELRFWRREHAKESGRKPRVSSINLGGF